MKKNSKTILTIVILLIIMAIWGLGRTYLFPDSDSTTTASQSSASISLDQDGRYSSPEEVAAFLHQFAELPVNFISKTDAMALGWDSDKGNLWDVTDHLSIGGDQFGNREGLLPTASGRQWYECDVNYQGGFRGAERLVYSNDGLIYYTDDHYQTFTKLY